MKETLCAIACAAFLVADANAQNGVTLFGLMDVGISYISNEGGSHTLKSDDSILTPSLWGMRGVENLGGGYKTIFEFQSQFSVNNGTTIPDASGIFNREAYIGLQKDGVGTITLGQQYNLLADFLFFPPVGGDGSLMYGGLYNLRQGPFAALGIPQNPTGAFDLDQTGGASRVSNSVKIESAEFSGLRVGTMYGFGNTAGSLSANNTLGLGVSYTHGGFGFGGAYNETRYAELSNGHDGIRNIGVGVSKQLGNLYLNLLYTYTKNTESGAAVNVVQVGQFYSFSPFWHLGANYQYTKGNAVLSHNQAQQITTALQYSLSKRTTLYTEAVYQWTNGDTPGTHDAWINSTLPSSNDGQFIARVGMQMSF
jgi:predicted porin